MSLGSGVLSAASGIAAVVCASMFGLPRVAVAQGEIDACSAIVRIGGRVHAQMATSSADGGKSIDFFTQRARITIDVAVSELVDGRIQPDFGESELSLKDAYFRLRLDPALRISFGQFKRAFDIFELNSSTDIVVVERTGKVDGLNACAGPGGPCSLSRFTEELGYSDRDVGVRVDGSLREGQVSYMGTITNGTGTFGSDENGAKSFAGRLTVEVSGGLMVSANGSHHDFMRHNGSTGRGTALGGDVEYGGFRNGTHGQIGLIYGENWRSEDDEENAPKLLTVQGILSYYRPLEGVPLLLISRMHPRSYRFRDGTVTPTLQL